LLELEASCVYYIYQCELLLGRFWVFVYWLRCWVNITLRLQLEQAWVDSDVCTLHIASLWNCYYFLWCIASMLQLTGNCEEELVAVLQHFCLLVPPSRRRQLQVLLRYLGKMSSNPRLVLHDQFTNRQQVRTTDVVVMNRIRRSQLISLRGFDCGFQ